MLQATNHMLTYDDEEETSIVVRSGEAETSQGFPLPYTKRDASQAAANTTKETEQLIDTTRLTTQSSDTTRWEPQI